MGQSTSHPQRTLGLVLLQGITLYTTFGGAGNVGTCEYTQLYNVFTCKARETWN